MISEDEIVRICEEHIAAGGRIAPGRFAPDENTCCPMTAVGRALGADLSDGLTYVSRIAQVLDTRADAVWAFVDGFDNNSHTRGTPYEWHQLGQRVRARVLR